MKTVVVPPNKGFIAQAGKLIKAGELVAFPTETVYGLGADALDAAAVEKIFQAKGRPGDNPLIVHIHAMSQLTELTAGELPAVARDLAAAYWPGPLTMVLEKSGNLPAIVSAGLGTVGIRMPSHEVARALLRAAGVPIAAPSANLSGRPSPTSAQHVLLDMDGRIPMILDGGECEVGLESTVVDVTRYPPRVLRPGGVTPQMIARVAGEVEIDAHVLSPLHDGDLAASPGMKHRHYAPAGELTLVTGSPKATARRIAELYDEAEAGGKTACILTLAQREKLFGWRQTHALGEDERQAAKGLFAALRQMDELGVDVILAEGFQADGLGLALMNRLLRAASFRIIDAGD